MELKRIQLDKEVNFECGGVVGDGIEFTTSLTDVKQIIGYEFPKLWWVVFKKGGEVLIVSGIGIDDSLEYFWPGGMNYNGGLDYCKTLKDIEDAIEWYGV